MCGNDNKKTTAYSFGGEEKYENDVHNRLQSPSKLVFRKNTSDGRAKYSFAGKDKPQRENTILQKLMKMQSKTAEIKHMESATSFLCEEGKSEE